ncbi:MAG: hypothetical protein ACKPEO_02005 [Sphaerospermopsis kisseleviana]
MEVLLMFPGSVDRNIDPHLKNIVTEIETENPQLSVFAARQFRYSLRKNTLELTVKEPRPFNVMEEFIIRAGLEFEPPPTGDELASILGLDPVFVHSTISTLQSLQTLALKSPITVTPEGQLFYEKGTVPLPAYTVEIYAVTDFLEGKLTCKNEDLNNDVSMKLPDLANLVKIEHINIDISILPLERIQQIIQNSGLTFHVPEAGKIVTAFKVIQPTQIIWKNISLLVIFDGIADKFKIQIRSGKRILEAASTRVTSLLNEGRISLAALCDLSDATINSARAKIMSNS